MHPYVCAPCGTRYPGYVSPCPVCWVAHGVVLDPQGGAGVEVVPQVMTAGELLAVKHRPVVVPGYPNPRVMHGDLVVLVGPPGAGKSTMLAAMLAAMRGRTLLASIEEPPGPGLAARLGRVGADHNRLLTVGDVSIGDVTTLVEKHKVVGFGVDSVQRSRFGARALRSLLRGASELAVVFVVSQVNRGDQVRGGRELEHEADVVVQVDQMRWMLSKSRNQRTDGVAGDVLPASGAGRGDGACT